MPGKAGDRVQGEVEAPYRWQPSGEGLPASCGQAAGQHLSTLLRYRLVERKGSQHPSMNLPPGQSLTCGTMARPITPTPQVKN